RIGPQVLVGVEVGAVEQVARQWLDRRVVVRETVQRPVVARLAGLEDAVGNDILAAILHAFGEWPRAADAFEADVRQRLRAERRGQRGTANTTGNGRKKCIALEAHEIPLQR